MPNAQSINQNTAANVLPNFRNLGVALRSLLLANGMVLLDAVAQATSWSDIAQQMIAVSALLQPVLLSSLLLLFMLNSGLARLRYQQGVTTVIILVMTVALAIYELAGGLYVATREDGSFHVWRNVLLAGVIAALILAYFRMRAQILSPALHVARLQALQARIRPHFLFNTINAVLGIVRADPKRAETALEDMADLFRMAMAHNVDQVAVHKEVELARQYLALEQLRLGERLQISWHIQEIPGDALMPSLILQPLLENAVYHGIEPLTEGGTIEIRLYRNDQEIHFEVRNPRQMQDNRHAGNKMALTNIRERLALQFDVEAHYKVSSGKDFYQVHIMLPYIKEKMK